MEKYLLMTIGQLRFIDSFQFMSTLLDKLVKNLMSVDLEFTHAEFTDDRLFNLVCEKGCLSIPLP